MKKLVGLFVAIAIAVTLPVLAGDYKCTESTQACLDKMAEKYADRGWVGIEMDHDEETGLMTVSSVVADSPAQRAGFKTGDELVALNGMRFDDEAQQAKMKEAYAAEMVPGNKVTYTVERSGHDRNLDVTLAKVPEQVLAAWIGGHMLDHASTATAQK